MGQKYLVMLKLKRLHRWSLGMNKYFQLTLYGACDYLSTLGLTLIHVSKRAPKLYTDKVWSIRVVA